MYLYKSKYQDIKNRKNRNLIIMKLVTLLSSTFIFLSSCSSVYAENQNNILKSDIKEQNNISIDDLESENLMLLVIADSEVKNLPIDKADLFLKLYNYNKSREGYAVQYLNALNNNGLFENVISEAEKLNLKNDEIIREIAKAYLGLENFGMAIDTISKIINKNSLDYAFLADIGLKLRDIDMALINLKEAYNKSGSKQFAMALARLEHIYLKMSDEAINLLENHNKNYSFDFDITRYLAEIYRDSFKYNESLKLYQKLYSESEDQNIANEIIDLMTILSLKDDLIKFLKDTNSNNLLLLSLYFNKYLFEDGYKLSEKLYSETGELEYLAQNAMFEYELYQKLNKKDQTSLLNIIKKLETVVVKLNDPTFLNYVGYLMVDHNIRIKDGVKYIREALKLEPDSPYITDSLAWGEYKLGNCKEAKKHIETVVKNIGTSEPEIKEHFEKINSCK